MSKSTTKSTANATSVSRTNRKDTNNSKNNIVEKTGGVTPTNNLKSKPKILSNGKSIKVNSTEKVSEDIIIAKPKIVKNNEATVKSTPTSKSKLAKTSSTTTNKSSPTTKSSSTTKLPSTTLKKSNPNLVKPKKRNPETPPSKRVSNIKYFPSKEMYSNALKEQKSESSSKENVKIKPVEKPKSKTTKLHSKSEVKIKLEPEYDRPRTATLKRGSIVNSNIAGPDIPIGETTPLSSLDLSYTQESKEDDYDYEDDFDSYESDFEEYASSSPVSSLSVDNVITDDDSTSSSDVPPEVIVPANKQETDEEKMLDSGNFDLPELKHKQLLENITESKEPETFVIELNENVRSNLGSLSDEGFEDGKSSIQSGNLQFLNFVDAQKKWKQNKNVAKQRKRGEEILSMIHLDYSYFTLLDIPAISYEDYIKSYGKTNTIQISTQTGDDDVSEEVQTDFIELTNKWTQFPVAFSAIDTTDPNYMEVYKREFVGVGDDFVPTSEFVTKPATINHKRLEKFVTSHGQIILNLLDESVHSRDQKVKNNSREIPFSKGYIEFETNLHEFLQDRPIVFIAYCSNTNVKILTVHGRSKKRSEISSDSYLNNFVCVWCVLNTKRPENVYTISGDLNCCCFVSKGKGLIFGGLSDGSISIWDNSNRNENQDIFQSSTDGEENFRKPNYITEIESGHSCQVVSICSLADTTDDSDNSSLTWKQSNSQICSLDENGTIILWSIISKHYTLDQSSVAWDKISIVQNLNFSLKSLNPDLVDLLCIEMNINVMNPNHIFVLTNYGYIAHCLVSGHKVNPRKYLPENVSSANCLEFCPFSPLYFFAGYEDGTVVLYSCLLEKPLMTMSNKDDDSNPSGIQLLQWSYHKPCVFYAKDGSNILHLWDLAVSDLYPIYSIPFKENITCMKLSPILVKNNDTSYMVLATESGEIYLHILNSEYGPSNLVQYQQDVKKFLNYVKRL